MYEFFRALIAAFFADDSSSWEEREYNLIVYGVDLPSPKGETLTPTEEKAIAQAIAKGTATKEILGIEE